MFFSSLKTLFARVVIFSLQVRCSNVKMSTTIVKRCFHPMIILPYACYQSVTNTVWASLARTECGDCGDALCCASPSSCSHKPSPSCQGDASVNTFQRRDHLALSSLRFALGQALSASFGSLAGQRSKARAQDDTPSSASFDSQNVFFEMYWTQASLRVRSRLRGDVT